MDLQTHFMSLALEQAKIAFEKGEVPVGAIIVLNNEIIASAYNKTEAERDATAHAEILAIKEASKKIDSWRLNECEMFVTIEPCTMCIGAIINARISKLYFGAREEKFGAVGSLYNIADANQINKLEVYFGILENECSKLMSDFFRGKRNTVDC